MKRTNIFYWIATALTALGFLMSAVMYLTRNEQIVQGFKFMGLPAYLIPFLGVAKAAGAIGILQTQSNRVKEWAYAGMVFNIIGAIYIHLALGLPFGAPVVFLALIFGSYYLHHRKVVLRGKLQLSV
ncbi:MAG TPA: DoxX family protein [Chitinophagaceae bacterium]|jgi:hypothetical protein|nr:DoxX family protein [Chitinophagaceae bacterium]